MFERNSVFNKYRTFCLLNLPALVCACVENVLAL